MISRLLAFRMPARAVRMLATVAPLKPKLQDVVVVGAGPAGLSVIAALKASRKTRHLSCTLVEAGSLERVREFGIEPPLEFTNRIISLTPRTMEFMQEVIGSWDYIQHDRVKFFDSIVAFDAQDSSARTLFDAVGTGSGYLAAMCEIVNIQSLLLYRIESMQDTENAPVIMENTKVEAIASPDQSSPLDWPVVTLDNGQQIQARLLIGADGYNSPVRHYAGIESRGWMYGSFGVVACVKLQFEDFRSVGWQRFLTTGPLAILPLPDDNATIVWSSTPRLALILINTSPGVFPHLVNAAMCLEEVDLNYIYNLLEENPDSPQAIEEIKWRMSRLDTRDLEENYPLPVVLVVEGTRAKFPLRMSHADTYVAPRVALVGDAAHTIHPLAGQGLNMGQADVSALVRAIERGVDRGMDIGSPLVLDNYVAEQWPMNHAILGVCDKFHKLFSTDFYPVVLLRGLGMKAFNMADGVKLLLMKTVNRG